MGKHRDRPLDPAAAEHLLAGGGGEPVELARLLAAASGPPRPEELAGEQAAVLAFWSARASERAHPTANRRRLSSPRTPALLPIRVAAVASALVAGGAALAAGAVALPQLLGSPSVDHGGWPAVTTGQPGTVVSSGQPGTVAPSDKTPSPSLDGLCVAHLAQAVVEPERARDNPAFAALAAAAGGREHMTDFCQKRQVKPSPSADPAPSRHVPSQPPSVSPPTSGPPTSGPQPNPGRSAEPETQRPSPRTR